MAKGTCLQRGLGTGAGMRARRVRPWPQSQTLRGCLKLSIPNEYGRAVFLNIKITYMYINP